MPKGVNEHFLRVLERERRRARRSLILALGAGAILYIIAELSDTPWFGRIVELYGVSLLVGVLIGLFVGFLRDRRYAHGIRDDWAAWMRNATGSASLREIRAKVRERSMLPAGLWGILVFIIAVANAVVFAFLWTDHASAQDAAILTSAANGLIVGAWASAALWRFVWATRFARALGELLDEGVVGLWGER